MYKLAILENGFANNLAQDIWGNVEVEPRVEKVERPIELKTAGFNFNDLFKVALFLLVGYLIINLLTRK